MSGPRRELSERRGPETRIWVKPLLWEEIPDLVGQWRSETQGLGKVLSAKAISLVYPAFRNSTNENQFPRYVCFQIKKLKCEIIS